jgi:hypothetical protein
MVGRCCLNTYIGLTKRLSSKGLPLLEPIALKKAA